MATIITSDCINCGACEPECPNTAIYQGAVEWDLNGVTSAAISDDIFYIVPQKCTECVGFFDQEACAAVCPVDCCLPDPDIPEAESVLIARAKELHPEETFGDDFPSRFKGADAAEPVAQPAPAAEPVAQPAPAAEPAPAVAPPPAAPVPAPAASVEVSTLGIPEVNDWEVPLSCYKCEQEYALAFERFRIGTVLNCPNPYCTASLTVTSTMYKNVANALDAFHARWKADFDAFREKRRRELEAFEVEKQAELEDFADALRKAVSDVKPAGKPWRRLSRFGFQRVG
jgi:ferredoxin